MEMKESVHKNDVVLTGTVLTIPEYSHTNHDERFYKFLLGIFRLSGNSDELVIIISEKLLKQYPIREGARVDITGQLRSYNNKAGVGSRLVITVYAQTIDCGKVEDCNEIVLSGVLCKNPVLRSTPLGREICDMMLAVNRRYGRADYIPCIAWGALANEIGDMSVGDEVAFEGRIQSRTYRKTTDSGVECRTAYEVSLMRMLDNE